MDTIEISMLLNSQQELERRCTNAEGQLDVLCQELSKRDVIHEDLVRQHEAREMQLRLENREVKDKYEYIELHSRQQADFIIQKEGVVRKREADI
jgi:hypothetical protein